MSNEVEVVQAFQFLSVPESRITCSVYLQFHLLNGEVELIIRNKISDLKLAALEGTSLEDEDRNEYPLFQARVKIMDFVINCSQVVDFVLEVTERYNVIKKADYGFGKYGIKNGKLSKTREKIVYENDYVFIYKPLDFVFEGKVSEMITVFNVIELEELNFSYPSSRNHILHNLKPPEPIFETNVKCSILSIGINLSANVTVVARDTSVFL